MSSTTTSLRIISHNVNRKYDLLSDELELFCEHFDILFVQEPPWRLIRKTVSASDKEGEPVVGPPTHPDWIILFRRPGPGVDWSLEASRPRVITYVNRRLSHLRPSFRTDIVDHRDVSLLTLFGDRELHLLNVYNDPATAAAVSWIGVMLQGEA